MRTIKQLPLCLILITISATTESTNIKSILREFRLDHKGGLAHLKPYQYFINLVSASCLNSTRHFFPHTRIYINAFDKTAHQNASLTSDLFPSNGQVTWPAIYFNKMNPVHHPKSFFLAVIMHKKNQTFATSASPKIDSSDFALSKFSKAPIDNDNGIDMDLLNVIAHDLEPLLENEEEAINNVSPWESTAIEAPTYEAIEKHSVFSNGACQHEQYEANPNSFTAEQAQKLFDTYNQHKAQELLRNSAYAQLQHSENTNPQFQRELHELIHSKHPDWTFIQQNLADTYMRKSQTRPWQRKLGLNFWERS